MGWSRRSFLSLLTAAPAAALAGCYGCRSRPLRDRGKPPLAELNRSVYPRGEARHLFLSDAEPAVYVMLDDRIDRCPVPPDMFMGKIPELLRINGYCIASDMPIRSAPFDVTSFNYCDVEGYSFQRIDIEMASTIPMWWPAEYRA